jgi:glutathione S-transferase
MTVQLQCFGESGNSYKAALTLTLCGIEWEPVWVDFFHGAARSPEFREVNVMGEAPVLIDGDRVMTQSGVIQLWAAERTGRFLGDRDEALRWVLFDNHKVSGQAGALRFHRNFLPKDKQSPEVVDWLTARLRGASTSSRTSSSAGPGLLARRPPSATSPAAAISTTRSPSASSVRSGRPSTPGSTASPACRAGSTPMT